MILSIHPLLCHSSPAGGRWNALEVPSKAQQVTLAVLDVFWCSSVRVPTHESPHEVGVASDELLKVCWHYKTVVPDDVTIGRNRAGSGA